MTTKEYKESIEEFIKEIPEQLSINEDYLKSLFENFCQGPMCKELHDNLNDRDSIILHARYFEKEWNKKSKKGYEFLVTRLLTKIEIFFHRNNYAIWPIGFKHPSIPDDEIKQHTGDKYYNTETSLRDLRIVFGIN
jgi:hypothetical protein